MQPSLDQEGCIHRWWLDPKRAKNDQLTAYTFQMQSILYTKFNQPDVIYQTQSLMHARSSMNPSSKSPTYIQTPRRQESDFDIEFKEKRTGVLGGRLLLPVGDMPCHATPWYAPGNIEKYCIPVCARLGNSRCKGSRAW